MKFNDSFELPKFEKIITLQSKRIATFLYVFQVSSQKVYEDVYFFLSYFVNSQIWLNQVMNEGISTTSHYGMKTKKSIALGPKNEMTVFDFPIIMNSPRIDI